MQTPRSDPTDSRRRELLRQADELLEDVEILRLGDRRRVPERLGAAIEKLQLDAGRGDASIAPATLRSAHELVLSVQYRLMSGNPRNATVIASRPVDTYILGKDDFRSAIEASESFREQLRRVYFQRH